MTTVSISATKRPASDAFGHHTMALQQPQFFDMAFCQLADDYQPHLSQVSLPSTTTQLDSSPSLAIADVSKKRKRGFELDSGTPLIENPLAEPIPFHGYVPHPDDPVVLDPFPHLVEGPHASFAKHVKDALPGLTCNNHPFTEVAGLRHKVLRNLKPVQESASSYIKLPAAVKAQLEQAARRIPKPMSRFVPLGATDRARDVQQGSNLERINNIVPSSPPNFGSAQRLDNMDRSLRHFYVNCMCPGRTLLPATNGWLKELLPMSDLDPVVHHALLAFSAGYCLEYLPHRKLLMRANEHYRYASELLTERLIAGIKSGEEDAVVGALRLMWCDDIVQWELRRTKDQVPRWYEATQLAKKIMKRTDSGYRYWQSEKRQCTPARVSNANMLALIDIVAATVSPLETEDETTDSPHPWLLAGDARDASRIHGGTGLSPKMLHMLAQITHICAVVSQDEKSIVMPLAATNLEHRILTLTQWSELSPTAFGCQVTTVDLLQTCQLDENGLANTEIGVTDLTAQAWREAAILYLRFRFYRLPREHADVRKPFQALREILRRLPCSGKLFTSQSPFYPVFLYGVAAVGEADRSVARQWFETIVERANTRSSVPPVWRVLQKTWTILDTDAAFTADSEVDHKPIGSREAWWELLVRRWRDEEGLQCIV